MDFVKRFNKLISEEADVVEIARYEEHESHNQKINFPVLSFARDNLNNIVEVRAYIEEQPYSEFDSSFDSRLKVFKDTLGKTLPKIVKVKRKLAELVDELDNNIRAEQRLLDEDADLLTEKANILFGEFEKNHFPLPDEVLDDATFKHAIVTLNKKLLDRVPAIPTNLVKLVRRLRGTVSPILEFRTKYFDSAVELSEHAEALTVALDIIEMYSNRISVEDYTVYIEKLLIVDEYNQNELYLEKKVELNNHIKDINKKLEQEYSEIEKIRDSLVTLKAECSGDLRSNYEEVIGIWGHWLHRLIYPAFVYTIGVITLLLIYRFYVDNRVVYDVFYLVFSIPVVFGVVAYFLVRNFIHHRVKSRKQKLEYRLKVNGIYSSNSASIMPIEIKLAHLFSLLGVISLMGIAIGYLQLDGAGASKAEIIVGMGSTPCQQYQGDVTWQSPSTIKMNLDDGRKIAFSLSDVRAFSFDKTSAIESRNPCFVPPENQRAVDIRVGNLVARPQVDYSASIGNRSAILIPFSNETVGCELADYRLHNSTQPSEAFRDSFRYLRAALFSCSDGRKPIIDVRGYHSPKKFNCPQKSSDYLNRKLAQSRRQNVLMGLYGANVFSEIQKMEKDFLEKVQIIRTSTDYRPYEDQTYSEDIKSEYFQLLNDSSDELEYLARHVEIEIVYGGSCES